MEQTCTICGANSTYARHIDFTKPHGMPETLLLPRNGSAQRTLPMRGKIDPEILPWPGIRRNGQLAIGFARCGDCRAPVTIFEKPGERGVFCDECIDGRDFDESFEKDASGRWQE